MLTSFSDLPAFQYNFSTQAAEPLRIGTVLAVDSTTIQTLLAELALQCIWVCIWDGDVRDASSRERNQDPPAPRFFDRSMLDPTLRPAPRTGPVFLEPSVADEPKPLAR